MPKAKSHIRRELNWGRKSERSWAKKSLTPTNHSQKQEVKTSEKPQITLEMPPLHLHTPINNKSASSNDVDLIALSTQETLKYFNVEELSLAELKNFSRIEEFHFSKEELRAMSPGNLGKKLALVAQKNTLKKKCSGSCFKGVKAVLFSPIIRQQLQKTDDSYIPSTRWNTIPAYDGKKDMETLPQFIGCKLPHENLGDVPDGTVLVFGPTPNHQYGHIAIKDGNKLRSDGEEIIANIPPNKYSGITAFIPIDSTINLDAVKESSCLEAYARQLKLQNIRQSSQVNPSLASLTPSEAPKNIEILMALKSMSRT